MAFTRRTFPERSARLLMSAMTSSSVVATVRPGDAGASMIDVDYADYLSHRSRAEQGKFEWPTAESA
jgi:hypothetical protein